MKEKNKPLLLRPTGKDYLWGGSRLNDEFEKRINLNPLAETWECSAHLDGPSYVVGGEFDGQELAKVVKMHPEYLGERHKFSLNSLMLRKICQCKCIHRTSMPRNMKMVNWVRLKCGMCWMLTRGQN